MYVDPHPKCHKSGYKQTNKFVCFVTDLWQFGRTLVGNEVKIVKYILGHECSLEGGNCPRAPPSYATDYNESI